MADTVGQQTRSWIMSRVSGRNTLPEVTVRSILHRLGFRFRLCAKELPGRPDIVNRRRRIAIFVNGCFWHGHRGCKYGRLPKSRLDYWIPKIRLNKLRDAKNQKMLKRSLWSVLVIWQCELRKPDILVQKLQRFLEQKASVTRVVGTKHP